MILVWLERCLEDGAYLSSKKVFLFFSISSMTLNWISTCRCFVVILVLLSLSFSRSKEVTKSETIESNELNEYNDSDYDEDYDEEITATSTKPITRQDTTDYAENDGLYYSWTKWSKWSKCSRSCDGGIQYRVRKCRKAYVIVFYF